MKQDALAWIVVCIDRQLGGMAGQCNDNVELKLSLAGVTGGRWNRILKSCQIILHVGNLKTTFLTPVRTVPLIKVCPVVQTMSDWVIQHRTCIQPTLVSLVFQESSNMFSFVANFLGGGGWILSWTLDNIHYCVDFLPKFSFQCCWAQNRCN